MGALSGFQLKVNIYAHDEAEVEECRKAVIAFIAQHAEKGRAVTARKVTEALTQWDKNPIIKTRIINYLKT